MLFATPCLLRAVYAPAQVRVVQNKKLLPEPVVLSNSTLRAVHGCHVAYMKNMGTQSTISLAVVVNDPSRDAAPNTDASRRLWGLVVCHHEASRYVPYPLRLACEFLMQASRGPRTWDLEFLMQASCGPRTWDLEFALVAPAQC